MHPALKTRPWAIPLTQVPKNRCNHSYLGAEKEAGPRQRSWHCAGAMSSVGPVLQQHSPVSIPRDTNITAALSSASKLWLERGFCKLRKTGKYLSEAIKVPHHLNSHLCGMARAASGHGASVVC